MDYDEEFDSTANLEREFKCPACKTIFKMKVGDIQGQKSVKCINTECGKEISLAVKTDDSSQFDRAMEQLNKTMDKMGDFKIDI